MRLNRNIVRGILWAWLILGTPVAAAPERSCAQDWAALYDEPIVAGLGPPSPALSPQPTTARSFRPQNPASIQQYTGPEANSDYVRDLLLTNMGRHFPGGNAAQRELLNGATVVQYQEGGIGFTALVEKGGELRRLKGLKPPYSNQPDAKRHFQKELDFAKQAAQLGFIPEVKYDEKTGLMEMGNIDGLDLYRFRRKKLNNMEPQNQAEWLDGFIMSMTKQVYKLHKNNIVHLDLTPGNIMISEVNPNKNQIHLIDYGFSIAQRNLENVHAALVGQYWGTPGFQGSLSLKGKPSTADDLQAIGTNLRYLLSLDPKGTDGGAENIYLSQRPRLRAVMALLNHPVEENAAKMDVDEYRLLIDAVTLDRGEQVTTEAEFEKMYKEQLEKRSEAERLEIMNEEPGVRDIVAGNSDNPEPLPLDSLLRIIKYGQ